MGACASSSDPLVEHALKESNHSRQFDSSIVITHQGKVEEIDPKKLEFPGLPNKRPKHGS